MSARGPPGPARAEGWPALGCLRHLSSHPENNVDLMQWGCPFGDVTVMTAPINAGGNARRGAIPALFDYDSKKLESHVRTVLGGADRNEQR